MAADDGPPKPVSAAPITAVIAHRVRALREAANLSGAALAKRLAEYDVNWNRTTVAKFETMQRNSITVQELLALALALNVPPVMLLADPRHTETVPITAEESVPSWNALLWMIGRLAITPLGSERSRAGGTYQQSTELIHAGWSIVEAVFELQRTEYRSFDGGPVDPEEIAEQERRDEERHRAALLRLRVPMRRILDAGAELPGTLTGFVYERAKELNVALPGMEN